MSLGNESPTGRRLGVSAIVGRHVDIRASVWPNGDLKRLISWDLLRIEIGGR